MKKSMILEKQNTTFITVRKYIGENLNSKKWNKIDPKRENYVSIKILSISEILEELKIFEKIYTHLYYTING